MFIRYLSGLILAGIFIPYIWFGKAVSFYFLSVPIILVVEKEVINLLKNKDIHVFQPFLLIGTLVLSVSMYCLNVNGILGSSAAIVFLSFIFQWLKKEPAEKMFYSVILTCFAIFYVGGLLSFVPLIRNIQPSSTGRNLLLFFLVVTYVGDTGAYHAGKSLGKHKLAPGLSPKKTVEGSCGGIFSSVLAGVGTRMIFFTELSLVETIIISIGINIFGQISDLVESTFKRAMGTKDSGNLIPGHGGMLDRTDSLFFSAPFLYFYWTLTRTLI